MPTRSIKPIIEGYLNPEQVQRLLQDMELDSTYKTEPSYSANAVLHPDHSVSFNEKHMTYLKNHPLLDPEHYLSNLRLTTRIRP